MRNTDFYLKILEDLAKGKQKTSELRKLCNGELGTNLVLAAIAFGRHINELEKGKHITGALPDSKKQFFYNASVEHSITPRGRAMLLHLQRRFRPELFR